jgi:hypothetical protein
MGMGLSSGNRSKIKRGRKKFFFEKKATRRGNQKTFATAGSGDSVATARNWQKFFASFFQKRSACFLPSSLS